MPDVEKVIKGLKYLHDVKRWSPNESEESITARRNITGDALALLKAQEPVEPTEPDEDNMRYCGACGSPVGYEVLEAPGIEYVQYNYCPECGKKVRWE